MVDPERSLSGWRGWALGALIALTILLIVVTFLPLWWTDRWWVRLWDFPRLQVAGLLLVVGIGLYFTPLGRWRWPLIGGVVLALAWQCTHFVAYFPPYPQQVASAANCPPERQLSLLNANVLMTNRDYGALLQLVEQRQPDVLLLLETSEDWARAVAPLEKRYPYRLSEPLPNTYGLILMSRLPMEGRIRHRLQPGVPSADARVTLRDGSEILLHALHPEPPLPGNDSGERDAELVMVGRQVRDEGRAAVVIGDLNDVAWSRTSRLFRRVAGMGDPRVGRGLYPTFTAQYPLLRWPLDHLFVSPHFELMAIDVLPDIGSDHFPIFFRLCLKEEASRRRVAPTASPAAEAEASGEVRAGTLENREEEGGR
jgi:endonuclease/exonuclease/phosphatase (EEP) superfamily protein YafD